MTLWPWVLYKKQAIRLKRRGRRTARSRWEQRIPPSTYHAGMIARGAGQKLDAPESVWSARWGLKRTFDPSRPPIAEKRSGKIAE